MNSQNVLTTTSNATLTQSVKDSIQIEKFIYHIIRKDAEGPDYNDEVELDKEQKIFFEERIKHACDGTKFIFTDPDENTCKADCTELLEDPTTNFIPISKEMTKRFFEAHNRAMNDGVFIVSIVSVLINDIRKNLLSFLKVDYSTVFQQKVTKTDGKKVVHLQRIMDSLADSPKALQKWAVIDPTNLFAWDALASQRYTTGEKKDSNRAVSLYFKNFLQVTVQETSSFLTRSAVTETHKWSFSLDNLPQDIPRSDFKARAIHYFENTDEFDTDKFVDQVLGSYITDEMDEDELVTRLELREQHEALFRQKLAEVGIAGQKFKSRPGSIPKTTKLNTWRTKTGVEIKFQGTQQQNNINVVRDGKQNIITIKTSQLDQD